MQDFYCNRVFLHSGTSTLTQVQDLSTSTFTQVQDVSTSTFTQVQDLSTSTFTLLCEPFIPAPLVQFCFSEECESLLIRCLT